MGSMAASGGYYISTAADKIYASPETLTGSLGVIMESVNYSKLADELGIKFETIKSGAHKDIMSPTRDMTKEERKIMQTMVNDSYEGFVNVISKGRHMSKADVKKLPTAVFTTADKRKRSASLMSSVFTMIRSAR